MRQFIILIGFVLIGLLLKSCGDTFSTIVEIDPPEFESKLTVTSFISAQDTYAGFFVGKNRSILDAGDFEDYELDSATVVIKSEATGEELTAVPNSAFNNFSYAYNYLVENIPLGFFKQGNEYTFSVDHPDYSESVTRLELPRAVDNLKDIVYKQNDGVDLEGDDSSSVSFDIVDEATKENYYELELYSEGGNNTFGTFWIETTDPSAIRGFPYDNIFFSDESFNGEVKNIKVKFDRWLYNPDEGDSLELRWKSISKDTYEYSKSSRRYSDTDGTSNVNNALGNISMKSEVIYPVR